MAEPIRYVEFKLKLSYHLTKEQWTRMAQLLQVPAGTLSGFKDANDLFTWMENHLDPNDAQKRPYLSAQRLDKLRELLTNNLVGAAASLQLLESFVKRASQNALPAPLTVIATSSSTPSAVSSGDAEQMNKILAACQRGDEKWLASLLADLSDDSTRPHEPLFVCLSSSSNTRAACLRLLLNAGFSANATQHGTTALHTACRFGFLACVQLLLERNAEVNARTQGTGNTPLHDIAERRWPEATYEAIVSLLLDHRADPAALNKSGQTPIHLASAYPTLIFCLKAVLSKINSLDEELNRPDQNGFRPLYYAINNDNHDAIQILCSAGANPLLPRGPERPNMQLGGFRGPVFDYACEHGTIPVIQQLIRCSQHDLRPHIRSGSPLRVAIQNGKIDAMRLLLVHEKSLSTALCFGSGRSALHLVAANKNLTSEAVTLLLECGANSNQQDEGGETPLHVAARSNALQCVWTLLKQGAALDLVDIQGNSPLHSAVLVYTNGIVPSLRPDPVLLQDRKEILQLLISKAPGLVDSQNLKRETPRQLAQQRECLYIIERELEKVQLKVRDTASSGPNHATLTSINLPGPGSVASPSVEVAASPQMLLRKLFEQQIGLEYELTQSIAAKQATRMLATEFRRQFPNRISEANVSIWSNHSNAEEGARQALSTYKALEPTGAQFLQALDSSNLLDLKSLVIERLQSSNQVSASEVSRRVDFVQTVPSSSSSSGIPANIIASSSSSQPSNGYLSQSTMRIWLVIDNYNEQTFDEDVFKVAVASLLQLRTADEVIIRKKKTVSHLCVLIELLRSAAEQLVRQNIYSRLSPWNVIVACFATSDDPPAELHQLTPSNNAPSLQPVATSSGTSAVTISTPNVLSQRDSSYRVLFQQAIENSNRHLLQELIQKGVDINCQLNDTRDTALHIATERNDILLVKMLLDAGAAVNAANRHGNTPFLIAASKGYVDLVDTLCSCGANVNATDRHGNTVLHIASLKGDIGLVRALLEQSVDVDCKNHKGETAADVAIIDSIRGLLHQQMEKTKGEREKKKQRDREEAVRQQQEQVKRKEWNASLQRIKQAEKDSSLAFAAGNRDIRSVNALLQQGASVNFQDQITNETPLHRAAQNGSIEIVNALLRSGAKIDSVDKSGNTPLFFAARKKHVEVMKTLLKAGANPNIRCYRGWTPLHVAAKQSDVEVIKTLISGGANLHVPDDEGNTPLHHASLLPYFAIEVVRILLEAGADPCRKNKDGKTASDTALIEGIRTLINDFAVDKLK